MKQRIEPLPESDADASFRALAKAFGREPVYIREGGSIPIVQAFQTTFNAPVVLIGFGLPGENAHAPNEWLDYITSILHI